MRKTCDSARTRRTCDQCGAVLFDEGEQAVGRCKECRELAGLEESLGDKEVSNTTPYRPGSPSKVAVMANRAKLGLPLFFPRESLGDIPD